MTCKIDKDIPLPEVVTSNNKKYPWDEMEVGDSFYADKVGVRAAASKYGTRHNMTFTTREEGKGFRVWRSK